MIGERPQPDRRPARPVDWLMLGLILATCAGLRGLGMARSESIAPDGTIYIAQARQMLEDPALAVDHYQYHPGYAMLVGGLGQAVGAAGPMQWQYVGSGVSVAMSTLALAALFFLARRLTSTGAALISTALFGLGAQFVETGSDVVSDPTALAMGLGALSLAISGAHGAARGQRTSLGFSALAGLMLGYGYLTRPEALALLAILPVAAVLVAREHPARHRRLLAANLAIGLIAASALVAPYAAMIGGLTRKKGVEDFVRGPDATVIAQVWAAWSAEFLGAVRRVFDRLRVAGGNVATGLVVVTVATWIGRYVLRLKLPRRVICPPRGILLWMTLGPLTLWLIMLTALELNTRPGYISSRHMLLPAATLAILAGPGLETLIQWALALRKRLGYRELARVTHGVFVILAIALALIEPLLEVPHEGKAPLRQVAGDVPAGPADYWLSHEAAIAYYAQAPPVQFQQPSGDNWQLRDEHLHSAQSVLDRAKANAHPVTFVAVPMWWTSGGAIICIADKLRAHRRFEPVAHAGRGKRGVAVFRLRPD